MKKIIFVAMLMLAFTSCKSIIGVNYEELTKGLDLGMPKQEVVNIMGKDYYIESLSETDEGKIEVLTYYAGPKANQKFTLYFINNKLKEFHKYIPPYTPQDVHIINE